MELNSVEFSENNMEMHIMNLNLKKTFEVEIIQEKLCNLKMPLQDATGSRALELV